MQEPRVSIVPLTAPDEHRRRRLVLVLVLLLGLAGGVLLGRAWPTGAAPTAGGPVASSPSSSTTASPDPSSSATTQGPGGPELCGKVQHRKFFTLTINDEVVDPSDPGVVTRHRQLNDDLVGCRWEWPGKTLSLVVGDAPIPQPWRVIDAAWDEPAPYGCHEDMGARADGCTSVMWGAGSSSKRLAAWTTGDGDRQCVIEAMGTNWDKQTHAYRDYELWDVCAKLLTGKSAS